MISRADHFLSRRSRSIRLIRSGGELGRAAVRCRGSIGQRRLPVHAVPTHPLRQALPAQAGLGYGVSNRAVLAAPDQSKPSRRRQRRITVGHEAGLLAEDGGSHFHPPPGTRHPYNPAAVTNVMNHNV